MNIIRICGKITGLIAGLSIGLQGIADAAQPLMVGLIRIPGTAIDRSGLEETLETQTPQNALGGFSAIEYSGTKNTYYVLSDRGAGDGAASFRCRFHEIVFDVDPLHGTGRFELVETHLLRDRTGASLTGSLAALQSWDGQGHTPSFDPEGIRCLQEDTLVISDEYGPAIDLFSKDGQLLESIQLPDTFRLADRQVPAFERGTYPNRGLEGIAVTPKGQRIVAAMQGPLIQDGRIEANKCLGLQTRWRVIDRTKNQAYEWIYPLDDESTGVSEVLAMTEDQFLVIERDSRVGLDAKYKRIYLVNSQNASDVSNVVSLREGIPQEVHPLEKTLLIDLLSPEYGLYGESTPEKPEGLAWGPERDGKRLLVVSFDNDFDPTRDSLLAAFLVSNP